LNQELEYFKLIHALRQTRFVCHSTVHYFILYLIGNCVTLREGIQLMHTEFQKKLHIRFTQAQLGLRQMLEMPSTRFNASFKLIRRPIDQ